MKDFKLSDAFEIINLWAGWTISSLVKNLNRTVPACLLDLYQYHKDIGTITLNKWDFQSKELTVLNARQKGLLILRMRVP